MANKLEEKTNKEESSQAKEKDIEEIFKEFKEHSVAEFFKKNRQMLGLFGKVRTLTTLVHEYVTNGLDACEDVNILPEIYVKLEELGKEHYRLTARDNGPGMPLDIAGKALGKLLAGTKFHRYVQTRGQQGIGASGVTMYSQLTTGKPVRVITGTGKKAYSFDLMIDINKNEPKITNEKELKREFRGTQITAEIKDVAYRKGEHGPLEYLRRTAISNPHAKITFKDPTGEITVFPRTSTQIPKKPEEVKPHPSTIGVDDLLNLARKTKARTIATFLKTELDRFGGNSLRVLEEKTKVKFNKQAKLLTWEEAEQIIRAFKEMRFLAPKTEGLRPIGEERILKSLKKIVNPEFLRVTTRAPATYSGYAFQVEAAIAYGGNAGRRLINSNQEQGHESRVEIMRFANKVPLLFDEGTCAIAKAVKTIDWKRYSIRDFENSPLTILVNVISVHIPYTSAGKQSIAEEEEIVEEVRKALMQSGRKISKYIAKKRREIEKIKKREIFEKYIPEVAFSLSRIINEKKENIEKMLEKVVLEKLSLDLSNEEEAKEILEEERDEENEGENLG